MLLDANQVRDIPPGLLEAFSQRRSALFVGAGASDDAGMPSWAKLTEPLAAELHLAYGPFPLNPSPALLAAIPQYYENRHGRATLVDRLRGLIPRRPARESEVHRLLSKLPCGLYYTTNFDVLLETALMREGRDPDVIADEESAKDHAGRTGCQIWKLHGTLDRATSVVITRTDFAQFPRLHPVMTDQLKVHLSTRTFLFVGYSLNDPDFVSIYDQVFFNLTPLNRPHYMTGLDVSEHERADLRRRGLEVIDLEPWGGRSQGGLRNFLSALCEATSERLHIERFFGALDHTKPLPLIIPSRLHESEQFVYYPHMDLHVAESLRKALMVIGVPSATIADTYALSRKDQFLSDDIVLVGSPGGNVLTHYVLEEAPGLPWNRNHGDGDWPISLRFLNLGTARAMVDPSIGMACEAPDPTRYDPDGSYRCEYALMARYRNPWAPEKKIVILAGLWAMGTYAIGEFLQDTQNYRQLHWAGDDTVAVLEVRYRTHDPYRYESEWQILRFGRGQDQKPC